MRPLYDICRYDDYQPLDIDVLRRDMGVSLETLDPRLVLEERRDGMAYQEIELGFGDVLGEPAHIHCRRAWPADRPALAPLLLIPGGRGRILPETAVWTARNLQADVIGLDWLCVGQSSQVGGFDPYPTGNAFLFDGDYRRSFQFFNIKALWSALRLLMVSTEADPDRAMVMGSSWGGFYAFLLGCLDPDIRFLFSTFGCGYLDHEVRYIWDAAFRSMGPEKKRTWIEAFDPGRRLGLVTARTFFETATNDKFFSMPSAMRSYGNLTRQKNLMLAHNQDHFTKPYGINQYKIINLLNAGREEAIPEILAVDFDPASNTATARLRRDADMAVSFIVSHGAYTKSFGRCWRRVPAVYEGGVWTAALPTFEGRPAWFYPHVENASIPVAGSGQVMVLDPERDIERPAYRLVDIDRLDYAVDTDQEDELPVGDRLYPLTGTGRDDEGCYEIFRFTGDAFGNGVFYCLDGDLIARRGLDALEVDLWWDFTEDAEHMYLVLVTDFHAYEEQCHGARLSSLAVSGGGWSRVRVPFSAFAAMETRPEPFGPYPRRPFDPGRLCGIGFFNAKKSCRGEVRLRRVSVFRSETPARPVAVFDPDELARGLFVLPCVLGREDLAARLARYAPWRMEVQFTNGFSTAELEKGQAYYTRYPLGKLLHLLRHVDAGSLAGGRALDIGCNIGYNCFHLRRELDMDALGMDYLPRHIEVARLFAELSGLDRIRFVEDDANHFRLDETFDLIVHFGTLDHLKHPFLALEHAAAMLKKDGWLLLETQIHHSEAGETLLNRFVPDDFRGDTSVWWFLDRETVLRMLGIAGFDRVTVVAEWRNDAVIGADMRRLSLVARKA